MSVVFSTEEQYLLALLKEALQGKVLLDNNSIMDVNAKQVFTKAKNHAVSSFLYDFMQEIPLFEEVKALAEIDSRQIVMQNYRLLFLSKYLVGLLEENGIQAVILKGVSVAKYYPVPELRKSGDVDLLIPKSTDIKQLSEILQKVGFTKKEEQHASHHIEFVSPEGILVEIHTRLTEDFAYKKMNASMEKRREECLRYMQREEIMGIMLPVLSKPFQAYELLLHMLHHFLRTGFGLKLLCDWVVLWKQEWSEQDRKWFEELAEESGTKKFAEVITEVCAKYLGMNKANFAWSYTDESMPVEDFLKEVFEAEEFGAADKNRMVMLNGTGLWAYAKEFHHQMHLNFPRAGKCFLLWPVLWMITLFQFLYNNRKVRKISTGKILKEAARRSRLMEELKL